MAKKKEAKKPIAAPSLIKVIHQKLAGISKTSNSHYVFWRKEEERMVVQQQFNDVCYARLSGEIHKARVFVNQHKRYKEDDPHHQVMLDYFAYITQRSPFKDAFLNAKKMNVWLRDGIGLDCERSKTYIMASITALREGWEFSRRLEAWAALQNYGFNEDEAYVLSQIFMGQSLKFEPHGGGHSTFIGAYMSINDTKEYLDGTLNKRGIIDGPAMNKSKNGWEVNVFAMPEGYKGGWGGGGKARGNLQAWFKERGKEIKAGWDTRYEVVLTPELVKETKEMLNGK